jgi:hypothetical protein
MWDLRFSWRSVLIAERILKKEEEKSSETPVICAISKWRCSQSTLLWIPPIWAICPAHRKQLDFIFCTSFQSLWLFLKSAQVIFILQVSSSFHRVKLSEMHHQLLTDSPHFYLSFIINITVRLISSMGFMDSFFRLGYAVKPVKSIIWIKRKSFFSGEFI